LKEFQARFFFICYNNLIIKDICSDYNVCGNVVKQFKQVFMITYCCVY